MLHTGFAADCAHGVLHQLCTIFAYAHSDNWYCDHCGELLPTEIDTDETITRPDQHLPNCPLMLHLAVFLMHPVLHKQPYEPMRWPTASEVAQSHQQLELQRTMFNAGISNTAGQSYDLLGSLCGMQMLQDDMLTQDLPHRSLICHRMSLVPTLFIQHLHAHNHRQIDAMWCYIRLGLWHSPCTFCGSEQHSLPVRCTALHNLAIFLTNGRRSRQSLRYLGQLADIGTDEGFGTRQRPNRTRSSGQGGSGAESQQRNHLLPQWRPKRKR